MVKRRFINIILATMVVALFLVCFIPQLANAEGNKVEPYLPHDDSFLYKVEIADLAQSDKDYDGKTVEVTGEVIGDQIKAEDNNDYCWITLTSLDINTDTVAVYMTKENAMQIDEFGKYQTKGTTLKVKGTYYVGCVTHSGITCLHATNVSVVSPGSQEQSVFKPSLFIPGFFAITIGFLLMFLYWRISNNRN